MAQPHAVQGSPFFVAFATCPVRSSAVLGNSKATSQAPQIITAPAQGSKLSKKMKANAPIKRRAAAARRSSALMAGITVKVIFYGQMLMTDSRMPDGRTGCEYMQTAQTLPDNGFSVCRAVINDCHTRPVLSVCLFLASHRKRLQSTFLISPSV